MSGLRSFLNLHVICLMQMMLAIQQDILIHRRIAEHKYLAIGKHLLEVHGDKDVLNDDQSRILKKVRQEN